MIETQNAVLISIIYQLLDSGANLNNLNPRVQKYLEGLVEAFNFADPEEKEAYEVIYYYADTFFNQNEEIKRILN